jgi:hypothetical protein
LIDNECEFGGAIYGFRTAACGLTNCTIARNIAVGEGGGTMTSGDVTAISCTIVGNLCFNFRGGGVHVAGGFFYIGNCVVAGNNDNGLGSPDVNLSCYSLKYNLIGITNGSTWYGGNDAFDYRGSASTPLNPLLGPLTPTSPTTIPVMTPRPGSPLIDKGDSFGLARDARGATRPIDQTNVVNSTDGADIGAVEVSLPSQLVYEWTFDNGDLSAALGPGIMSYADGSTPSLTRFGTTDGTTVPHIGGEPATYMHVPAFTSISNGYQLTLTASGPNAGGYLINQFTWIADVFVPAPLNWLALFNTSPSNDDGAELYISPSGAIGIDSTYSAAGVIHPNTWHRIAFAVDSSIPTMRVYVDGTRVLLAAINSFDGGWSMFSNIDPGPDLFLFNEGDSTGVYTHELYVASLAMADRMLDGTEIAALGAPAADGIFVRRLRITCDSGLAHVTWRGAPNLRLERTTTLRPINWQPIAATLGASSYTIAPTASSFYRVTAMP